MFYSYPPRTHLPFFRDKGNVSVQANMQTILLIPKKNKADFHYMNAIIDPLRIGLHKLAYLQFNEEKEV